MTELFLDALKFLFDIPEPNAAIPRCSHEFVGVAGMELPVVNCVNVAFRLPQLFHPHVPFDCQEALSPISVQEGHLLASIKYHQQTAGGVKSEIPNCIPSERLYYSKAIHIFVHAMEVPQPYVII